MTETKCTECGVTFTTGTQHICKEEDIQKQEQNPKICGHGPDGGSPSSWKADTK